MKTTILVLSLFVASLGLAKSPAYEAGTYTVDTAHSKVGFEIPHLVVSTVEGSFGTFEGQIDLAKKFQDSKLTASVDIASLNTGNAKRDDHLKSPDFFDAAKYPKMTFKSTSISGNPEKFKLNGDLTIKGVTKKVTFDSQYMGQVNDGMGNLKSAFRATTKVNRKDFGLNWSKAVEAGPVVGDELTINLKIEAGKPVSKK